jgi:hypothetical protein
MRASDPVHPNSHIYAKMALNLIEKIAPVTDLPGATTTSNRKRTWSASNSEDGESSGWSSQGRRAATAGAAAAGSGHMTAEAAVTAAMVDPDPDPAELCKEAQLGRQAERAAAVATAATITPANGAEEQSSQRRRRRWLRRLRQKGRLPLQLNHQTTTVTTDYIFCFIFSQPFS